MKKKSDNQEHEEWCRKDEDELRKNMFHGLVELNKGSSSNLFLKGFERMLLHLNR